MEGVEDSDMVVLLWHRRPIVDEPGVFDSKLIGVFCTEDDARAARVSVAATEGFIDHPDDFSIESLPTDQVLHDTRESGLAGLVEEYLDWRAHDRHDDTKTSPGRAEGLRLHALLSTGSQICYQVVEELHTQETDRADAEAAERELVAWWTPNNLEHGNQGSESVHEDAKTVAKLVWEYRRQGYPEEPEWQDSTHPRWSRWVGAHRVVVLLDGLDDRFILSIIQAMLIAARDLDERRYLILGPLTTWLTLRGRLSEAAEILAQERVASPPFDSLLREWEGLNTR